VQTTPAVSRPAPSYRTFLIDHCVIRPGQDYQRLRFLGAYAIRRIDIFGCDDVPIEWELSIDGHPRLVMACKPVRKLAFPDPREGLVSQHGIALRVRWTEQPADGGRVASWRLGRRLLAGLAARSISIGIQVARVGEPISS
jgi:hypothetical protein